jgi:hypothetical protein
MNALARLGTALGGVAWLACGVVLFSFTRSSDAGEACDPQALWTGGWFFAPPLIATAGLVLTSRSSSRQRTGVIANALLLAFWGGGLLPLYLMIAIGNGASCAGG